MNEKKARALRKFVGKKDYSITYTEEIQAVWGNLPRHKITKEVNTKKLKKLIDESNNPKLKGTGLGTLFRYVIGKPITLKLDCWRKQYQLLKQFRSVVA